MKNAKASRRRFLSAGLAGAAAIGASAVQSGALFAAPASASESGPHWDETFDVIVVGSGMSGITAAISAKANGCGRVVVIEKMPVLGGSSAIAAGDMAAVGSSLAKKHGIKDSPELMAADIAKLGGGFNHPELTMTLAENCGRAMDFIVAHGAKFYDKLIRQNGHSATRVHQPVNGCALGALKPLHRNFVEEMKGEIRTRVKLDKLIKDESGRIVGVAVRENYNFNPDFESDDLENTSGVVKHYRAVRGVIMGSGGYGRDVKFRQMDTPQILPEMVLTAGLAATAGAFRALIAAGARPVNMAFARWGLRLSASDMRFSCMVNPQTGKRCMNESLPRPEMTNRCLEVYHSGARRFPVAVLDRVGVEHFDDPLRTERQARLGYLVKYDTLEALAEKEKIPFDELKKSIDRYNELIAKGKDEDFGKDFDKVERLPIKEAPFYASLVLPVSNRGMGGVLITPKAEVIDMTGSVIPGLYAAGEAASGVHGSMSLISTTLPAAFTFGMIAGESIAKAPLPSGTVKTDGTIG